MRKTQISRLFQFLMAVSVNVLPVEQGQARKHRHVPDGIVYEELLVIGAMPQGFITPMMTSRVRGVHLAMV